MVSTTRMCEHGKRLSRCIQCGGSEICEHGIRKEYCKDCGGSAFCEHGRQKYTCKECKGNGRCVHGKFKRTCKDCGGSKVLCEHGKRKIDCAVCDGSNLCMHGRQKHNCRDCGTSLCEHGKVKKICKNCNGVSICIHGKQKQTCPDCEGTNICKSRREPYFTGCRTNGNRKLNGFCSHCFVNIFPDDPKALRVRTKSKEIQVMTHVFSKYDGFKNDKPFYVDLQGGCCATKRRIDLRKLINNTMLCIEVDENQHKQYIKENENNRYDDLFMDFSGKYIFIRYNPDKFIDKYGK